MKVETLIINSKYSKCKGINRGNNYVLNYSFTDVKYYDGSTEGVCLLTSMERFLYIPFQFVI